MSALGAAVAVFMAAATMDAVDVDALRSPDWAVRRDAVRRLIAMGAASAALDALKACAGDATVDSQVPCAWAVHREGGDAAALEMVTGALTAGLNFKRINAVEDLAALRDVHAGPLLVEALRRWPWQARRAAADGLGDLGDERAAPALAERLGDSAWVVRRAALLALAKLARNPVRLISTTEPPWSPRPRDFEPVLRRKLIALVGDEWPGVQGGALAALGRWGKGADYALIVRATRHRNRFVRHGALLGLAATRDRRHAASFRDRLLDAEPTVGRAAAQALRELGESIPRAWAVRAVLRTRTAAAANGLADRLRDLDDGQPLWALGSALFDGAVDRTRATRQAADSVLAALRRRPDGDTLTRRALLHALSLRDGATHRRAGRALCTRFTGSVVAEIAAQATTQDGAVVALGEFCPRDTLWSIAARRSAAARLLEADGTLPVAALSVASFFSPLAMFAVPPLAPLIAKRWWSRRFPARAGSASVPESASALASVVTNWPRHATYNMRWQNRFNAEIMAAAAELPGLDPLVLKSLLAQESNFDPWARNDYDCAGLAQFCPYAARGEGLPPSRRAEDYFEDPRYQPALAIRGAVRHLKRKIALLTQSAFRRFGTPTGDDFWAFVLASYNGGERQVYEAMARTYRAGLAIAAAHSLTGLEQQSFAAAHARHWRNLVGDVESFLDAPLFGMTTEKFHWYRPYGRYAPLAGSAAKYFEIGMFPVEILVRAGYATLLEPLSRLESKSGAR